MKFGEQETVYSLISHALGDKIADPELPFFTAEEVLDVNHRDKVIYTYRNDPEGLMLAVAHAIGTISREVDDATMLRMRLRLRELNFTAGVLRFTPEETGVEAVAQTLMHIATDLVRDGSSLANIFVTGVRLLGLEQTVKHFQESVAILPEEGDQK